MTAAQAKQFCKTASDSELLLAWRLLKKKQQAMSLSAIAASCRVSDKMFRELKQRKVSF